MTRLSRDVRFRPYQSKFKSVLKAASSSEGLYDDLRQSINVITFLNYISNQTRVQIEIYFDTEL